MKLAIRGESWTVSTDESRLDADDDGATFASEKLIVVRPAAPLAVIRHELLHAYCSTLYTSSTTSLALCDYEEMVCDLMGEWLTDYVTQCGDIMLWQQARV